MATEILAIGTGAADSSEVTVTASTPATVCLKDAVGNGSVTGNCDVRIKLKDDDAAFFEVGQLNAKYPAIVLTGPGVYICSRTEGSDSCGVFSA